MKTTTLDKRGNYDGGGTEVIAAALATHIVI